MALAKIQKTIFKVNSNTLPAAGHTYSIQNSGGGSAIPIYSNSSGTVPLDNPGTLPANGLLSFFIRSGTCRIKVTDPASDPLNPDEQIWDNVPCISPDVLSSANATLQFATVADLINGNPINKGDTIDFADYVGQKVTTVANNSTSGKGGADYTIWTLAAYRTFLGAGFEAWVPDGTGSPNYYGRDHYVGGGTTYVAILDDNLSFYSRGAISDGATDQSSLLQSQLLIDKKINLDRGNFAVTSLSLSDDNLIIKGRGNQISRLTPTAVSPAFAISMTNDYTHFEDMRIGAAGTNMIQQSTGSYFNYFNNVWFGPSDLAIDVTSDFYWTNFVACHFRDNETAIRCTSGDDFNAVSFLGGTFYHFNAASAGPSLDLYGSRGVSLLGVQVQNQGIKLDTCDSIEIAGGYWECYDVPTIEAIDSRISIGGGIYFPNASRFKFDVSSIKQLNGFGPNLYAKDSDGINQPDNTSQRIAPVQKDVVNLFDDGSCSTQKAIDALAYSPTGSTAARIINGSSNVEISFASTTHRAAFRLPNAQGISIYVKWRATAGTGRLALQNTDDNMSLTHNSADDSEWRHCHWHALQSGANPAIVFDPQGSTSTVIEVDTIIVSDQLVFIQAESQSYQLPSGQATMPSAATVAVTFPQPPTGNYRIFLQGDVNETFWYSSKTTTGFTINSSNATSTANVYWEVRLG